MMVPDITFALSSEYFLFRISIFPHNIAGLLITIHGEKLAGCVTIHALFYPTMPLFFRAGETVNIQKVLKSL